MEYLEKLLRNACERCEEGKFDTCECKSSCPVYGLYCEVKKKNKVVYRGNDYSVPPPPKPEMI